MLSRVEGWINRVWYGDSIGYLLLLPLCWLYAGITSLRRWLYRSGIWRVHDVGLPVIVIGNITTGGTGKTPLTVLLVQELRSRGYSPGILSRGYRGDVGSSPLAATADSDPSVVGDEPLLLAKRCACPIVVHPDRVAAGRMLAEQKLDVIIADDGLQHYSLARNLEIVVVDGKRLWGNGRLLPAGPLRESVSRLQRIDHLVLQTDSEINSLAGLANGISITEFSLKLVSVERLDGGASRPLDYYKGRRVHGVAAIGNPDRFFDALEDSGMEVVRHPFSDHATLTATDLTFDEPLDILMTEKDAVKCRWPTAENLWYVPVNAVITGSTGESMMKQIEDSINEYAKAKHD